MALFTLFALFLWWGISDATDNATPTEVDSGLIDTNLIFTDFSDDLHINDIERYEIGDTLISFEHWAGPEGLVLEVDGFGRVIFKTSDPALIQESAGWYCHQWIDDFQNEPIPDDGNFYIVYNWSSLMISAGMMRELFHGWSEEFDECVAPYLVTESGKR